MDKSPVNFIETKQNTIKVGDFNSPIALSIFDHNHDVIDLTNKIDYFLITKDDYKYYEVTEYTFENEQLIFKIPNVRKGLYRIEIKDLNGSIYPSNDDVYIQLINSFDGEKEQAYTTIKDDIINKVKPIVYEHIEENQEFYKGKDGKDGRNGIDGKDGKNGIDGKDGEDGVDGKDGQDGVDGQDGKDGTDITGVFLAGIYRNTLPNNEEYTIKNFNIFENTENFDTENGIFKLKEGFWSIDFTMFITNGSSGNADLRLKVNNENIYTISKPLPPRSLSMNTIFKVLENDEVYITINQNSGESIKTGSGGYNRLVLKYLGGRP